MKRFVLISFFVLGFLFSPVRAEQVSSGTVKSTSTATVVHYSYPPKPEAEMPVWWQKTVRFIRYWAEAFGAGAAAIVRR